jgi:hypothetical protein
MRIGSCGKLDGGGSRKNQRIWARAKKWFMPLRGIGKVEQAWER